MYCCAVIRCDDWFRANDNYNCSRDHWDGTIRNVRIYDYALTRKELDSIE